MESIEIAPGITFNSIQTDKFKTTTVCLLIHQALTREYVTFNALIPLVLRRGCNKYDNLVSINNVTERMYGSIFEAQIVKKGEQQIILFYIEFMTNTKENMILAALEFLHEMVTNPLLEKDGFKADYVNSEKQNLCTTIEKRTHNKTEYAKLRCLEFMCEGEAFGLYGDGYCEDIERINPQNLYQHYRNVLRTAPIDFVVVGNENMDYVKATIRHLFQMPRETCIQIQPPIHIYTPKKPDIFKEYAQIIQGKQCIGIRTHIKPIGKEFYQIMLLNEMLGGGANSKLFVNVREKESLCYYIYSILYRFKMIIIVQAGLDVEHFDIMIQRLNDILEMFRHAQFTEQDVEYAKGSLLKKLESTQDFPSAIADFYISQKILGDTNTIENTLENIKNIEVNELSDIVEKLYIDTVYQLAPN